MPRLGVRMTLALVAVLSLGFGAGIRAWTWHDVQLAGDADRDLGRPVTAQPVAVAKLGDAVRSWAKHCAASGAPGIAGLYARLDAVARLVCSSPARGVTSLTAYQFTTGGQLATDVAEIRRKQPFAVGSCVDGTGGTVWSDRNGRPQGRILCTVEDGGKRAVYWTDDARLQRFAILGSDVIALHAWWENTVRPQGAYPTPSEQRLLAMLATKIDIVTCRRAGPGSPMSIAEVTCDRGKAAGGGPLPADSVDFALFGSVADAQARIAADAAQYAHYTPFNPTTQTYLGHPGTTTYSLWRSSPDKRRRGNLAQFSHDGDLWTSWTVEAARLYGRIGRGDENPAKTYAAFALLGQIGLS